jgi:hypothetical protein
MVGLVACRLSVISQPGLCIVLRLAHLIVTLIVIALLLLVAAFGLGVIVMLCAVASLAVDLILVRHDD